jgi:hypothetical protein
MARLQLEKLSADAEEEASEGQELGRRYVCVPFSPWRHQDFEDVKVALMSAVLDRLAQEITDPDDEQHERIGRLSGPRRKFFGGYAARVSAAGWWSQSGGCWGFGSFCSCRSIRARRSSRSAGVNFHLKGRAVVL